jgi:hypothetical protein
MGQNRRRIAVISRMGNTMFGSVPRNPSGPDVAILDEMEKTEETMARPPGLNDCG